MTVWQRPPCIGASARRWLPAVLALFAACRVGAAPPAWQADFESGEPGGWQAYGEGCTLAVSAETAHAGRYALVARFDDASGVAWANKGARIAVPPGLAWADFRYVLLYYRLDQPAQAIGCLLHDRAGNWWRAASDKPALAQWAPAAVSRAAFTFAWNDDPNQPPGTKDAEIAEIFLFAATETVNRGARYTLALDDIAFCNALPDGLEAPAAAAPAAPPALPPPEAGEPFPLQWRVTQMDARGYLTVDGRPFFPLGIYSCIGIDQASGAHPTSQYAGPVTAEKVDFWLRAVHDAGFNLLQTYTMQFYGAELTPGLLGPWKTEDIVQPTTPAKLREGTLRLLDLCQTHGLKLMAGSSPPYCATILPTDPEARAKALAEWRERVRPNVQAWKAHPALLAWYLIDEPSSVNLPARDLTEQYRYLKELDFEHPLLLASCAASDLQYGRAVDIIAPDPYPIETGVPLRELPARIRPLRAVAAGTPPLPQTWAVIQICQWVEGRRLPSEAEMRLLALTALAQDVTGLLFYEFRNYPDSNPEHWQKIGRVVRSLQAVLPALLAPGIAVRDVPASDRRVYALAKQVGSGPAAVGWLIAANPSQNLAGEPMALGQITFSLDSLSLPAEAVAVALDEDGTGQFRPGSQRPVQLKVSDRGLALSDDFGALAAHIYRIGMPPAPAVP
jgi:hypothetical protein